MKKSVVLFLFFSFLIMQQAYSVIDDNQVIGAADKDIAAEVVFLEENQNETVDLSFDDDEDFLTLTDLLVNAYASFRHFIQESALAIVTPVSSAKEYVVASIKDELGQEKYYASVAPATIVLGAKNIQMLFSFLTHILLKSNYPPLSKLKIGGLSLPLQEFYEQCYQMQTKDVLTYEQKTVMEKISKLVPEVFIVSLWYVLAQKLFVGQMFGKKDPKFKIEDNMHLLLQGQLANLFDASVDEFLTLEIDQVAFGLSKALLRGATVFARADVKARNYELTKDNYKHAAAEALLPLIIDGFVHKIPFGFDKTKKRRIEICMQWASKVFLRQLFFPQK